MKTYLHGPVDTRKRCWNRDFGVGDLDLPERRKRHTSSRKGVGEEAQMCPCGKAVE